VAGGYRLGVGAAAPPLLLDDEEATAIVIALCTAAIGGITVIAETAVGALAKLGTLVCRLPEAPSAHGPAAASPSALSFSRSR